MYRAETHLFIPLLGPYLPLCLPVVGEGGGGGGRHLYLYCETGKKHANFGPTIHPCRLSQYVSMFSTNEMDEQRLLHQNKIYTGKYLYKSGTNKAQLSLPISTKRQYYKKSAACIMHMSYAGEILNTRQTHKKKCLYWTAVHCYPVSSQPVLNLTLALSWV
jgi:hypothetical protein